jgi:Glycosyl hydrolase 36 superfamily, catalytic domain/Glycosyltransferase family 36
VIVPKIARRAFGAACVALLATTAPAAGSSHFGRWTFDRFGLPAFVYGVDERTDPLARQPELQGGTAAQHQVGNDRIVGQAFNHGYTQLWSQERRAEWANRYDEATRHYAGGFGWLRAGARTLSTLYLDLPARAAEREFGVGSYRRRTHGLGFEVTEDVYAPFGDDPVLLHDVVIRNRSRTTRRASWFEYWDVNPFDREHNRAIGVREPRWNPRRRTLSAKQLPGDGDNRPLTVFLAALRGPVRGHETSVADFFGTGTRARPAAVAADRLDVGDHAAGTGRALFALRAPLRLRPAAAVRLRYVYGLAPGRRVAPLVTRLRRQRDPAAASARRWARWLPHADFGPRRRSVARELAWDAYLLRSASVYEAACGHHTVTQGGYYQYGFGQNLGSRSWLHYALPLVYMEPELAREILRYSISLQSRDSHRFNQLPYGTGSLCRRVELGSSSDLDFWLLLAAGEYGLGARDPRFFDERLPFYEGGSASAWRHLKIAFRHQESLRGPRGGYLAGEAGDWSDFSSVYLHMTETLLVPAQLAYAYPRLAQLAELRGDRRFAATLRRRGAELRAFVARQWTGRGWYARGFSGDRLIGSGAIFGEPQPWAVLAGVPTPDRARRLVANIRRFLTGIGAPGGPTRIGSTISPAAADPDVTEPRTATGPLGDAGPLVGASQFPGGVWFDVNGWLTWALSQLDGVVPGARRYAWDEYRRNTLEAHTQAFPNHWDGTISVDDACNGFYSPEPARCGIGGALNVWAGEISEQPTWMVMNAIRLAGVTATRSGYRIAPHYPFTRFSLRTSQVAVTSRRRELRGYVTPQIGGPVQVSVMLPAGMRRRAVRAFADGRPVPRRIHGRQAVLELRGRARARARWAVTW